MAGTTASLSVRKAIRSGRGCTMFVPKRDKPSRIAAATRADPQLQVERLGRSRETAFGDDAAALDERDPIAGGFHFAEQMGIEKHRDPVGAQFGDDVAHQQPSQWIEAGGRLVQEHELRLVQQRLCQPHALQHALAVAAQRAIGRIDEVHAGQQSIDAGVQRAASQPIEAAVKPQQLRRRERVVKTEMLGKKADARARRAIAERGAEHLSRAGCRLDQRQQHLDRGGLAGAVRPEEPEDLARTHAERQIRHGDGGTELLAQLLGLDNQRTDVAMAMASATC